MRTAREEGGISLDQAVHETNISRSYLIALEEERFEVFTADAYLIGFLRNYSDFLGVDTDRILGQYRNYKLNESPSP
ncbi:MAG: transcriptional regulator, partial [spirochete symbiont of Stewartia floridana]